MTPVLKLLAALAAVIAIGLAAFLADGAPGSAASAQDKLEARVEAALGEDGDWASVHMDGQKAVVTGEAPSEDARSLLIARIGAAAGRGGLLAGGVTAVDARGLAVAPKAQETPEPQGEPEAAPEDFVIAEAPPPEAAEEAAPADMTAAEETYLAENETPLSEPDGAAAEPAPAQETEPTDCMSPLREAAAQVDIRYSSARSDLEPEVQNQLRNLAVMLNQCPAARLEITGHTDSSGTGPGNFLLSRERAQIVREFLIASGAPVGRIAADGVGEEEPVASNATEEGRRLNRRIEFEILPVN